LLRAPQPRSLGLVFSYFVCFSTTKVYKLLIGCICIPADFSYASQVVPKLTSEDPFCNIQLKVNTMIMVCDFSGKRYRSYALL